MVFREAAAPKALDKDVYDKRNRKGRKTNICGEAKHERWRKTYTECDVCGGRIQNASLRRHMMNRHSVTFRKYSTNQCQEM